MNSIEFINLEIATLKSDYKKHINFGQTNFAIADEKRLNHLQQIKSELEAWEVVSSKISVEKGTFDYANINIKDWHHHLTREQYQIIKKALEVEED